MRPVRLTAVAFIAASTVVLTGCGGSDTPSTIAASATPGDSTSATPEATESTTSQEPGDVGAFPQADGYAYKNLPSAVFASLKATVKGTSQIKDVEAKLVTKDGKDAGMVIRLAVDPDTAAAAGFEDGFLPGFAGGVAGSSATPDYEDINGTKVVIVSTSDGTGAAYAWLQESIATVLVFKDVADAESFAHGALG